MQAIEWPTKTGNASILYIIVLYYTSSKGTEKLERSQKESETRGMILRNPTAKCPQTGAHIVFSGHNGISWHYCIRRCNGSGVKRLTRARVVDIRQSSETYTPPSSTGGCTELKALERFSVVIPDSQTLHGSKSMMSGTVSRRILAGIMANPTSFGRLKFGIEQARLYDNEGMRQENGLSKSQLQVCRALVNTAGLVLEDVVNNGRVSIEVDPRVAYDADGLRRQGEMIWSMCAESGIPKERILIQMPATWAAIEAAAGLEMEGLQTHLVSVYSYGQAVAAVEHGVSVIQVNVGRINDWYDKNPGAIRDPNGPREVQAMAKAGYGGPLGNPGLPLVKKIYTYIHHAGKGTKLISSGMRTKKETLSLAGSDYLVVGEQILKSLESTCTLEGYNDGLRATGDSNSVSPAMSPEHAATSEVEKISVSEVNFKDALGLIGADLLTSDVERAVEDAIRLEPIFLNRVGGQE